MSVYNFQQIWGYAEAKVACRVCGKTNTRRIREYCTVNPFNKNDDGSIKSPTDVRQQAYAAAEKEAARQIAEGRICRKCAPLQAGCR